MADQKINLKDIPLAPSSIINDSRDSVLGLVGPSENQAAKRIALSDIKPDLTTINSNISTLQTNVGTLQTDVGTAQTDISSLKTQTSPTNSDLSNSNLNSLIDATARKVGYAVQASVPGTTTNPSLAYTGYEYTNDNLGAWTDSLLYNIGGAHPTQTGSGASATYDWSYSTNTAMGSNFVVDLKSNLKSTTFDNTWTSGKIYEVGAVVVYNNTLYKCKTRNSDVNFTAAKWDALSSGSGGSGISGSDFEIWQQIRNIVLEGITRELSPELSWTNPYDTISRYSNNAEGFGYWENATSSSLGYQRTQGGSASTDWFNHNNSFLFEDDGDIATGDSVYKTNAVKLRTNLLKMLSTLVAGYKDFEDKILYQLAYEQEHTPQTPVYNNIPIGSINNGSFDCFVSTDTPTYTGASGESYNLSSSSGYNEKTDLVKSLLDLCAPKRITGIFRAENWVIEETRGRINWCPLTDISNPDHAHILHSAVYSDEAPDGEPYEEYSGVGFNYIFNDAIMDVYLPGIEYGTTETDNTLRKQILEAYNMIQDTNVSYSPPSKTSMQQSMQFANDDGDGYDMIANYNNWQTGGDCGGIVAYLDPDAEPPSVDIPVQILIFPKFHNRTDYLPSED